jgi:lysozyme
MIASIAARGIIASFEGFSATAYQDGGGVWTIGYGHTKNVVEGDACTRDEADAWLAQDMQEAEDCVNAAVTVPLTQCQFDALVSFTYNVGCGNFKRSTMLKLLNASDYLGASRQFLAWNKIKGEVSKGLTNRRMDEMKLFLREPKETA